MGYGSGAGTKQESKNGIDLDCRLILRARVGISTARMYLADLENKADMGRMVDSRGSGFNASKPRWIEIILRIATETKLIIPDATNDVIYRLMAVAPEVVMPDELKLTDEEIDTIKAKEKQQ